MFAFEMNLTIDSQRTGLEKALSTLNAYLSPAQGSTSGSGESDAANLSCSLTPALLSHLRSLRDRIEVRPVFAPLKSYFVLVAVFFLFVWLFACLFSYAAS